ncbi:molybdopterin-guanine dinucleotide biosynthesis protein B [Listeria sp. PSOL-1]|uniref:molybdopterin-guanine dinucleotide biosynthesis protein B n=1 Tax=Listeria sp. PSOL-1 TaxID=1844999 RepID=UPI0013D36B37|nr:molybdopterin-guanine dinucleotide biosynthesis protein B [Listeria sp. PSOL-1]
MAVIIQVIGFKNSGKTTFINQLIHEFKQESYTVAALKHDYHDFNIDHEGTDSYSFHVSGADAVLIASSSHYALMETRAVPLKELLNKLPKTDIVLIEGYKEAPFPKVVLVNSEADYLELKAKVTTPLYFASRYSLNKKEIINIAETSQKVALAKKIVKEFSR